MSEWVSKQLGKAVTFQKGKKVETSAEELPGYLRYLGAGSLVGKNDGYASTVNAVRATSKDVLMLWDGERSGLVGYDLEGVVSSTVSKLATLGEVTAPYLYYFLSRNFEWIQNRRTGTGVPHVPKDLGRIMAVDFPKCENTQKKITDILQTIDEAIKQTEALIEKYSLVKAGMMHDLFTRGLTPDGKLRPPRDEAPDLYKETSIGCIPKDWDVKPLGELTTKIVDGVHHTPTYVENGVPFVTVKNLTGSSTIDFTNLNYVDEKTHRACYARADPKAGDVLVTKDGTLGTCRIVNEDMPEFSIFVSVALLRVSQQLTAEWLHFFFESGRYLKQLGYLSAGSGLQHIHLEHFRKFQIALPQLAEQVSLNAKTRIIERKLECERALLAKLRSQKLGLMNDLLTGEVKVKVNTPEATHV